MRNYVGHMRPAKQNIVRKLRILKGLRQKDVADVLGIHKNTLRAIEINKRKLKLNEQAKLARYFGVREYQLYEEESK